MHSQFKLLTAVCLMKQCNIDLERSPHWKRLSLDASAAKAISKSGATVSVPIVLISSPKYRDGAEASRKRFSLAWPAQDGKLSRFLSPASASPIRWRRLNESRPSPQAPGRGQAQWDGGCLTTGRVSLSRLASLQPLHRHAHARRLIVSANRPTRRIREAGPLAKWTVVRRLDRSPRRTCEHQNRLPTKAGTDRAQG